jgi:hypothetical protein
LRSRVDAFEDPEMIRERVVEFQGACAMRGRMSLDILRAGKVASLRDIVD